jgi:hypothetical protein
VNASVVARFIVGERISLRSRQGLAFAAALSIVTLGYATMRIRETLHPLTHAPSVKSLPPDHGDVRFGVPLARRKEVFAEVAAGEPAARAEGTKAFPGANLAWSAEDHRGAFERKNTAAAAQHFHLSLTQVYLILDEGIRERWPGPDGEPLKATSVPLHPRRNYGW